ncbi:uncharacterized protein SPPG_01151 [Spizellomyces punctatus DAOM BR117]|uniref:Uncharacterized protein n=1 Tax=Spizellomyces punctatus (strain DAOM BR117) TaxID=645134 RepID=A0A0L0HS56_SPIPD|nr:uncharacterized protein SPPG_01151 [Spizellomyces punctatus DAOM BR117]KND03684.1 hypothetical protein SPPG_01151 [Spizellomyces punctatus DAOM BR117]|eukprot:XP_016611723.1 hypothetical protein SPPG_01151 [Spizellomyces punctatus DAOM BR117]
MKFQTQKFDLESLVPPVRMVREVPKPRKPVEEPTSTEPSEAANKEKMDPTKVAPFGNAVKNRQNLFKKKTKSYIYARDPDDDNSPRRPRRDPDRFPWILSDFDGSQQYTGNVEGMPESSYLMLAVRPKYRTLTAEEADEMMKLQSRKRLDTWLMHKAPKEEDAAIAPDSQPKEEKGWIKKILEGEGDEKNGRARRPRSQRDDDAGELDYEEEFADDEELLFGIEDEEEAKEAIKRQYGKHGKRSGFLDDEDDEDEEEHDTRKKKGVGKDLRKALRKADQADDVYHSDEANPYLSDEEESDEEEANSEDVEVKTEPGTEDAAKQKKRKDGESHGIAVGLGKKIKREDSISPSASPEHILMDKKKAKSSAKSPSHLGSSGRATSSVGRAASTSPLHGSSPAGAGRSVTGKKRKGPGSDDEKVEKKPRTEFAPVTSSSASEILKQLAGSASPPHLGSSRPPSVRSKAPTGRPKAGSARNTPMTDSAAAGGPSAQATARSTPLTEGGARGTPGSGSGTGKRKVKKGTPGGTPRTSPTTGGSSKQGSTRRANASDIIDVFRREKKDAMQLGELVRGLSHIMGKLSKEEQRNIVRGLIKNVCNVTKTDSAAKSSGVVLSVKPEFKDW